MPAHVQAVRSAPCEGGGAAQRRRARMGARAVGQLRDPVPHVPGRRPDQGGAQARGAKESRPAQAAQSGPTGRKAGRAARSPGAAVPALPGVPQALPGTGHAVRSVPAAAAQRGAGSVSVQRVPADNSGAGAVVRAMQARSATKGAGQGRVGWRGDADFVAALVKRTYARVDSDGALRLVMADGIYMYMWELFCDGRRRS
jgi:hypothetical protein